MLVYCLSTVLVFAPLESRPGQRPQGTPRPLWAPWALADATAAGFEAAVVERALFAATPPPAGADVYLASKSHRRLGWEVVHTNTARIYDVLLVRREQEVLLLLLFSRGAPDAKLEEGRAVRFALALVYGKGRLNSEGDFTLRADGPSDDAPAPEVLGNVLSADLEVRSKRPVATIHYESAHSPGGDDQAQEWRARIRVLGSGLRLKTAVERVK